MTSDEPKCSGYFGLRMTDGQTEVVARYTLYYEICILLEYQVLFYSEKVCKTLILEPPPRLCNIISLIMASQAFTVESMRMDWRVCASINATVVCVS